MMRLGIFGGTFAPFHKGHRKALEAFFESARTDRCLVIPAGIPPHKQKSSDFTDAQRLEMTRLACADLPWAEVSDWEIRQEGASYTCKTLQHLSEEFPDARLVLYVGSDMFLTLQKWYRPEEIFRLAEIAAFSRTGEDFDKLSAHGRELKKNFPHLDYTLYPVPPFPVSSTEIREKWINGEDISSLVHPKVAALMTELQTARFTALLTERLSDHRLKHSLGVAKEAEALAGIYGISAEKARIAGLLHDMTKEVPKEEHFRLFAKYSIPLDENLRNNKNLWHAASASADATETFGITDPEILSAIRYHTTGKADMTLLEMILYMADLTDETRDYDDVDFYWMLARDDLEKAALVAMRWCRDDVARRGFAVHEDMLKGIAWLEEKHPNVTEESEKARLNYPTKGQ